LGFFACTAWPFLKQFFMRSVSKLPSAPLGLHDRQGHRLYLTTEERAAFLAAAQHFPREVRTFCVLLHDTGCRVSEALALTADRVDFSAKALTFETLKKRKRGVFRVVPVPDATLDLLAMVHGLRERKQRQQKTARLWPWSRVTAWRRVLEVMDAAQIADGPHKCPKGLRHGYGVHAISKNIPLNMLSKWMGHASLEVTAIYANALGEEQRNIAARMWS
jgi:integrase/recombinase XerD